jgi:transposase
VRDALVPLVRQLHALDQDRAQRSVHRRDGPRRQNGSPLDDHSGLWPRDSLSDACSNPNASAFSGPHEFAASLGLTPRENSSDGGKERLGRVSKMGNRYLRKLLVVGAHAVLYHRKPHEDALRSWAKKLMQTKLFKRIAIALVNKMARIAFAIMRSKTIYSAA